MLWTSLHIRLGTYPDKSLAVPTRAPKNSYPDDIANAQPRRYDRWLRDTDALMAAKLSQFLASAAICLTSSLASAPLNDLRARA
jgi:hypothetical protein